MSTLPVARESSLVPLPPVLDTEALRRRLAGLADPTSQAAALTSTVIRDMAIRFVSVLAHLFGHSLERITLWSRIDSALVTSLAKVAESPDLERFASLCLDHVRADAAQVAACEPFLVLLETLAAAGEEDRSHFLIYLQDHRFAALAFARQRWELVKKGMVDL